MKPLLMFKDHDFDIQAAPPLNSEFLIQDLELNVLFNAMSTGDPFLLNTAKHTLLSCFENSIETIRYRQDILRDALANPTVIRELYQTTVESEDRKKRLWSSIFNNSPGSILNTAVDKLSMFVTLLRELKIVEELHRHKFQSEGMTRFFNMVRSELDHNYLNGIETHLKRLKFYKGMHISAAPGKGNEGGSYMLRKPFRKKKYDLKRIIFREDEAYSFSIPPRDESGFRALTSIKDAALNETANALAVSADHIDSFFKNLRIELSFYICSLNLAEHLSGLNCSFTFPSPHLSEEKIFSFKSLYDISLSLTMKRSVTGNDMTGDSRNPVIITGANQGGKSTFLRSIGIAQLMMQCGMFVPADAYNAGLCNALFTHFRREEDPAMKSGRLDEELLRMDEIILNIKKDSMILFNESFSSTNEREGSEIARQITRALAEKNIRVFFVTHLYDFACSIRQSGLSGTLFLRAEREEDGRRSYRIIEGEPLPTAFGEDLYREIFKE